MMNERECDNDYKEYEKAKKYIDGFIQKYLFKLDSNTYKKWCDVKASISYYINSEICKK